MPCAPGLDLEFCARSFTLSGGNIRSAATTAGYLAAGNSGPIGMPELISAIQQEYRKLGRLVLEREFGQYYSRPAARGDPALNCPRKCPRRPDPCLLSAGALFRVTRAALTRIDGRRAS